MCPNNPIGTVDLYMVAHHGTDSSGTPQLVHALRPRVAVMQNGTRKGAGAETMPTLRTSPGLEDIWQLHWGLNAGIEQNSAGVFVANVDGAPAPSTAAGPAAAGPAHRRTRRPTGSKSWRSGTDRSRWRTAATATARPTRSRNSHGILDSRRGSQVTCASFGCALYAMNVVYDGSAASTNGMTSTGGRCECGESSLPAGLGRLSRR